MRPIAHSGQLVRIRNCVGEFDTGQPLVTTNEMSYERKYVYERKC